jgi:hypothetical protein
MKKQYDITRLTDELNNSVFFQQPEQTEEPEEQNQSALAPKHQVTKALSNDSATSGSNQSSIKLNDQSTKAPSKQRDKATKQQSIVALKHFSSYLEPGTYKAWKVLATQREKRDYEILQEAVEQYLEREARKE